MKFRDLKTGAVLETDNELVMGQYKKNTGRYRVVAENKKKSKKND